VYLVQVVAIVLLIAGMMQIVHRFRARAMRAFAAKRGFRYIGPTAPKWWNPSHFDLPHWISDFAGIRQVWNVIEGQRSGMSVFICDGVIGARGGQPCTFIVCQSEQDPFGTVGEADRVVQSHGLTILLRSLVRLFFVDDGHKTHRSPCGWTAGRPANLAISHQVAHLPVE
jgi:hypothetical protein